MSRKNPKPHSRFKRFLRGLLITILSLIAAFVALVVYIIVTDDGDSDPVPGATAAIVVTVEPTDTPTKAPTPTIKPTATASPAAPTATIRPTAAPISYSELSRGMKGEEVRQIQERLNKLGYSVGTADGSYGAKTVEGVSTFQKAAGLAVTGVATPETQSLLYSPDAPRAPAKSTQKPSATKEPIKATERPAATEKPSQATKDPTAEKPVVTEAPRPTEAPVVTDAPKPTKKPESSGGSGSSGSGYVASVNSEVFHYPSCEQGKTILEKNRIFFSSRDKAVASGRRPCKNCNP